MASHSGYSNDLTNPDASRITVSNQNSQSNENAVNAFDNNIATKWVSTSPIGWIRYEIGEPVTLSSYTLTSGNDFSGKRDPKHWRLYGTNDDTNWSLLDTQNNVTNWGSGTTYTFNLSVNQQSYQHYILDIIDNNGGQFLELAEIELRGNDSPWIAPEVEFFDRSPNSKGSVTFHRVYPNLKTLMENISVNVAQILYRNSAQAERFKKLTLDIRSNQYEGSDFIAYKFGNADHTSIVISTDHIQNEYISNDYSDLSVQREVEEILYHEVSHGYQATPMSSNLQDNWSFIEGLADAVRISVGLHKDSNPTFPENKWLGGYTTTGFFFHYVGQEHDPDFLYLINKAAIDMNPWSYDAAFQNILGRSIDDTWEDYETFVTNGEVLNY